MGSIIHKRGDLFSTHQPIIGHGCNASNGFASGVAGQVARLFPGVKRAYHEKFEADGWKPGDVQFVEVDHPRIGVVANLCTQRDYGRDPRRVYVDYDGLALAVRMLFAFAADAEMGVALPRIGCGLAGGDWSRVEAILRCEVAPHDVMVEVWTP